MPWRPPWTVEQERDLWIAAGNHKDKEAQATLCEGYESLIRLLVDRRIRKIYPRLSFDLDDVVQECFVSLLKAWGRENYRFPLVQKDGSPWNRKPFWRHYLWRIVHVVVIQMANRRRGRDTFEVAMSEDF